MDSYFRRNGGGVAGIAFRDDPFPFLPAIPAKAGIQTSLPFLRKIHPLT